LIIFHLVNCHCSIWFNLGLIFAWETFKLASVFWSIIYNIRCWFMMSWSLGFHCQILCVIHHKKSQPFLLRISIKKTPPHGFFTPMSNLTKMPFKTSCFGLDHFDWDFLVNFFLLNHHDNYIILVMTKKHIIWNLYRNINILITYPTLPNN
jgi:hypothetical protein